MLQPGDPPIAAVMAQSLRDDFQTPVRWVEPRSHDTWENAEYSARILRANGIGSVQIVLDTKADVLEVRSKLEERTRLDRNAAMEPSDNVLVTTTTLVQVP